MFSIMFTTLSVSDDVLLREEPSSGLRLLQHKLSEQLAASLQPESPQTKDL